MQNLAQDVGGLKKVLSNVKMRGGLGEVRLEMLMEQVLAPEQYEANVKTRVGSTDVVEFAIKLPGKDDDRGVVYLPIDAKFPQEAYHHLIDAYELGDPDMIESASKSLDDVIKRMARDIHEKYIDPPNTTEFGIMFLPFEGLYAEVIRRSNLMEKLQREYQIMVTGPTTLAAILNSLQMGFKTLAIQKRSGEVWKVLGAIKTEFEKFGGMLEKAQKNLHTASNQLDELVGKRTKAIQRRLRDVESLPQAETSTFLPEVNDEDSETEEEESESKEQESPPTG
jgi:DNA recombination protein RmuC